MTRDPRFDRLSDVPELLAPLLSGLAPAQLEPARKAALRERVMAFAAPAEMSIVREDEGQWVKLLPKVYLKRLMLDRERREQTTLWRLEPGAVVPGHDHTAPEECLILEGRLLWDGLTYGKGDYLLAPVGLHHTPFSAPEGALLLIRGELSPELAAVLR